MESLTIYDNEKYLRQHSKDVIFPDKDLQCEIEILKEYLRTHDYCFAMASIQLGIPKKLIIIKSTSPDLVANKEKDWLILINPKIISQKGKTEFWEACMSGLLNFSLVERPYQLTIKYQNQDGKEKTQQFEGFVSTVLSHELDHLEGIFHMDRALKTIQMSVEGRAPWRKEHPYKIISKDCDFEYQPINIEK